MDGDALILATILTSVASDERAKSFDFIVLVEAKVSVVNTCKLKSVCRFN